MCNPEVNYVDVRPGEREQRLRELADKGFHIADRGMLRTPDPRYRDSAERFLASLTNNPPTPEEIFGSAAILFALD